MYQVEKQPYGVKFIFGGHIKADEMRRYADEAMAVLSQLGEKFCVFVDMRKMFLLPQESQVILGAVQQAYRDKGGLLRVVLIMDELTTKTQMQRVSKSNGVYRWERYISTVETPDWEKVAFAWLLDGVDPDKHTQLASRTSAVAR